ncbi:DNA adenine methylase [Roseofilum sp. BLCC_M91]|uniref:Site-specific DNA-methyltransferase (adenine-specific) n=1 Tax=Roseofilum halophilum BLCC-M91 TaxID=3022259 RepID=A0ABT7BP39_9CYAN|nr:DNA adenine methylase [Roseofilum halophilum]MDJ1180053.1 DNA adenine methylase [Roseofilum halophilum BLCC-M91]
MTSKHERAKPFLKWAGGKSQLLSQFESHYPPELKQGKIERYIEPFLGGGAVFFDLAQTYDFNSAFLYDVNQELVLVYQVVKHYLEDLISELEKLAHKYHLLTDSERKNFYFQIRDQYNRQRLGLNYEIYSPDSIVRASWFIFLNRTCFNGLFRLNSKGEFNVPPGKYKHPKILDADNLRAASNVLQKAEIIGADFESCESVITDNSFVYFDPPYRPLSQTASFTAYAQSEFADRQQQRLAQFFRQLDKRYEVKLMLSNSDPKNEDPSDNYFEQLYDGFRIERVSANRMINSKVKKRGLIQEIVVKNY